MIVIGIDCAIRATGIAALNFGARMGRMMTLRVPEDRPWEAVCALAASWQQSLPTADLVVIEDNDRPGHNAETDRRIVGAMGAWGTLAHNVGRQVLWAPPETRTRRGESSPRIGWRTTMVGGHKGRVEAKDWAMKIANDLLSRHRFNLVAEDDNQAEAVLMAWFGWGVLKRRALEEQAARTKAAQRRQAETQADLLPKSGPKPVAILSAFIGRTVRVIGAPRAKGGRHRSAEGATATVLGVDVDERRARAPYRLVLGEPYSTAVTVARVPEVARVLREVA